MKAVQNLLLALGTLGLAILLWRVDFAVVRVALLQVGWGMALILGQETVAHVLNALGWRFAFARDRAASFTLVELLQARVAGDAINYLTPSATIAGEVARTAMLSDAQSTDVRAASVVVAKSTQTLGQVLFAAVGLVCVGAGGIAPGWGWEVLPYVVAAGTIPIAALLVYRLSPGRAAWSTASLPAWLQTLGARLRQFVRDHPGRVVLSTLMFVLAYAWGAFEAYWICRFLLIPVTVPTALTIEVLSVTIDGVLFLVPAKIGTQEGSKMAIFAALGLPPSLGFAFGIVRHIRELTWAGLGMLAFWAHRRPPRVASAMNHSAERGR